MTLPRITVVTPSFNQAQFLEAALLSVLGQQYPDLEYLVMDGGSTDGSAEIIARFAPQLAYWQTQKDGGQAAALNTAFARATGDVLCWLNSDDYLVPGALHRVGRHFAGRTGEAAVLYGSCLFFREGEAPSARVLQARRFDAARLRTTDFIIQPSAFWTRRVWQDNGPLDAQLSFGFDWDWFIRASGFATFEHTPEILSAYRRHEAHKSGSGGTRRRQEVLAVVRRHAPAVWQQVYDFADRHWAEVQRWSRLRQALDRRGVPQSGRLAQAVAPALWALPEAITLERLRVAAGMLEDA